MPSQMKICFLCKTKESNISYHRFPKDAAIRSELVKFCNLNKKIDVHLSSLLLCSEHFSVQDFSHGMRNTCEAGVRRRLNKTAIPTLNKISSGLFPCYVNDDVSNSSNSCAGPRENLKRRHDEMLNDSQCSSGKYDLECQLVQNAFHKTRWIKCTRNIILNRNGAITFICS
ncbi:unnamed protein product [Phaedon cochleariae]|uniref:THAP-type domain-containing protein n=1 Tax=Phaedon cochleariae TaxID=80249 RepID=A0A9P0DNE3_PHACE|nr:unnamed protein product [Phaedon cochleariae]